MVKVPIGTCDRNMMKTLPLFDVMVPHSLDCIIYISSPNSLKSSLSEASYGFFLFGKVFLKTAKSTNKSVYPNESVYPFFFFFFFFSMISLNKKSLF
jgi:hypothetical protein